MHPAVCTAHPSARDSMVLGDQEEEMKRVLSVLGSVLLMSSAVY